MSDKTREPSKERGCNGKMAIGSSEAPRVKAIYMAIKHGKDYGVYKCSHCHHYHLTTKLDKQEGYAPLVYRTRCYGTRIRKETNP